MKKILLMAGLIVMLAFTAEAQRVKSSYPYWVVSKEVHKQQFRNTQYTPATLTTTDARISSKGIATVQARRTPEKKGRVTMSGTPSWVISKGVARMQYEKNN